MKRSNRLLKDISQSVLANIISMGLGMVAVAIIPKYIGVEKYGFYQLYVLLTTYVIFFELGFSDGNYLNSSGDMYSALDYQSQANQFWLLTISQWTLSIFISIVGVAMISDPATKTAFIGAGVCSLFIHARYYLYMLMQGTGRIQQYAVVIVVERVISIGLSILAIAMGYGGYGLLIIFDILGRGISLGYAVACSKEIVFRKPEFTKNAFYMVKRNVTSGIALTVVAQASTVIIGVSKTLVQTRWDIATFAQISLCINFLNLLIRCANAISIGLFPHSISLEKGQREQLYHKTSFRFSVLVCMLLLFYAPALRLIKWWFPEYSSGISYMIYVVPMCIYECRNAMIENVYMKAFRKDRQMLKINVMTILIGISTSVICVFSFHSIPLLLLCVSISVALRCIAASHCLEQEWKTVKAERLLKISEALIVAVFVLVNLRS